jgi:RimJ/RimL family protein N-acetyltransferase
MVKTHLMGLSDEDKYRRFYIPTTETSIDKYLGGLELMSKEDAVFVVYNGPGDAIIGLCQVAIAGKGADRSAELALSVDGAYRGRSIGYDMLDRAMLHCKSLGIYKVFMYCLASNRPMQQMARKLGMTVITEYDESTGSVELTKDRPGTALAESFAADAMALYDLSCRQAVNAVSCLMAKMITPPTGVTIPIKDS